MRDSSHILFSKPFHICSITWRYLAPLGCKTTQSSVKGTQLLRGVKWINILMRAYTVIEHNYAILSVALGLITDSKTDYFSRHINGSAKTLYAEVKSIHSYILSKPRLAFPHSEWGESGLCRASIQRITPMNVASQIPFYMLFKPNWST